MFLQTARMMSSRATRGIPAVARASRLGDRLRQLRVAAGLTQSELARDRFSKEYISQIERGKTRPTPETIEWLAAALGVDPAFLASGVSSDERARAEAVLARAEALVEKRDFDARDRRVRARARRRSSRPAPSSSRCGCSPARPGRGCSTATSAPALELLDRGARARRGAGVLRPRPRRGAVPARRRPLPDLEHRDRDRALRRGARRCSTARSFRPTCCARSILTWRSRCYRRQRDYEAAREDVERALELAESMNDTRALGEAYFQASLIAERDGHWVLARTYAERAKAQYEELSDRMNVGRLLNNLGGLDFLLGKPEKAIDAAQGGVRGRARARRRRRRGDGRLVARAGVSEDRRSGRGRGACAPRAAAARRPARIASTRSGTRGSYSGARCSNRGGSTKPRRCWRRRKTRSPSSRPAPHRAAAWVAQGDLAQRRGDDRQAAVLYRQAAEALQDFRF